MPTEHIVWRDGGVLREHTVTTDKIRPCRYGLIVQDGGPVSIAFVDIISREHVVIGRASMPHEHCDAVPEAGVVEETIRFRVPCEPYRGYDS